MDARPGADTGREAMKLEFVPLLQVQRDLYRIPRGWERFRAYLRTMIDPSGRDIQLPLVAMNPMGKDHVPALLDALLALDADGVAARAVAEVAPRLEQAPGVYRVALVIADDLMGGWTNRYACEFGRRFESQPLYKRGWLTGLLWTSEPPSARTVREEVLTTVYRAAYIGQHGPARTLRERLAQEGRVMALAGCDGPTLDAEDREYTRAVLAPYLEERDMRTAVECLFGDAAARTLGFTPQGLSERAGLALALHDARADAAPPVAAPAARG
jgi:hypothetical protein